MNTSEYTIEETYKDYLRAELTKVDCCKPATRNRLHWPRSKKWGTSSKGLLFQYTFPFIFAQGFLRFLLRVHRLVPITVFFADLFCFCKNSSTLSLGLIHIWRPWKLSNFQDLPPPCPSTSKIFPPPWPWTSNFKQTPSLQMITNQLKENII